MMQLADFIRTEIEPIIEDWDDFTNTVLHAGFMEKSELRDHARDMLLVIADDIESRQDNAEQLAKSKGRGPKHEENSWGEVHGVERQTSGFSVTETVSEFRALRASVVSHWTRIYPRASGQQLDDLARFHEAIDGAVAESLEHYATTKEKETRLFGSILNASPDPIFVLDTKGQFIYANEATANLFALNPRAIIGQSAYNPGFAFVADLQRNLKKVISDQAIYRGKFTRVFPSGKGERFEYLLAPVLDEHKKPEATVCVFRDVTERVLAEEKVWHNAHHDLRTGLPNRRLFLDRLEQEVKHAKRSSLPLSVLFLDLDGFKEVNDSLEHDAGDRLLSDVTERLKSCVREDDTIARLGGNEFTIILTGTKHRKSVDLLAQTIIDTLARPFHIAQQYLHISVSIGVSFYPRDGSSPVALLQEADQAMYRAKRSGANQVYFSNTSPLSAVGATSLG